MKARKIRTLEVHGEKTGCNFYLGFDKFHFQLYNYFISKTFVNLIARVRLPFIFSYWYSWEHCASASW